MATSPFPMSSPAGTTPCMPSVPARPGLSNRRPNPAAARQTRWTFRFRLSASRSPAARRTILARSLGRRRAWARRFLKSVILTASPRNSAMARIGGLATSGQTRQIRVPSGASSWNTRSIFRVDQTTSSVKAAGRPIGTLSSRSSLAAPAVPALQLPPSPLISPRRPARRPRFISLCRRMTRGPSSFRSTATPWRAILRLTTPRPMKATAPFARAFTECTLIIASPFPAVCSNKGRTRSRSE